MYSTLDYDSEGVVYGYKFLVAFVALVVCDSAWIMFSGKRDLYPSSGRPFPVMMGLMLSYDLMVAFFIALVNSDSYGTQAATSVVLALWVYGTFNLTSLATNNEWSVKTASMDTFVGITVYMITFMAVKLVHEAQS